MKKINIPSTRGNIRQISHTIEHCTPFGYFLVWMWVFIASTLCVSANADGVGNLNRRANRLYSQEKYEDALKLYDEALLIDPSDNKLKMNRGSSLYRLGEFEEAEQSYLDALSSQQNNRTRADAHYNLGNVQFRLGEQLEEMGDISSARGKFSQALENYVNTLKLRPNDMDAKWNLELANNKVELLESMQEQQQQSDDDDDNQQCPLGDQENQDDPNQPDNPNSEDDEQNDSNQQQQNQQPEQDRPERDMQREEAERLIEQFADDAEELNKPPQKKGRIRQPEKDW